MGYCQQLGICDEQLNNDFRVEEAVHLLVQSDEPCECVFYIHKAGSIEKFYTINLEDLPGGYFCSSIGFFVDSPLTFTIRAISKGMITATAFFGSKDDLKSSVTEWIKVS